MIGTLSNSTVAIIVCITMFAATVPPGAQSVTSATWQDEVSQHYHCNIG